MVKCPYCGYEAEFRVLKTWHFGFYNVSRIECLRCHGVFNYYQGVSPKGKRSEFVIRVRPRAMKARSV